MVGCLSMLLIGWVGLSVVDWLGGWCCSILMLIGWVFEYVVDWLGGSVCC